MSNGAPRCFWLHLPIKRQETQRRPFSLFSEEEEGESGMGGSLRASRASQGPAPVFPAPRSKRLPSFRRAQLVKERGDVVPHKAPGGTGLGGDPAPLPSGRMMSITGRLWIVTNPSDVTNTRDALHQNNNGGLTPTFKADVLVLLVFSTFALKGILQVSYSFKKYFWKAERI